MRAPTGPQLDAARLLREQLIEEGVIRVGREWGELTPIHIATWETVFRQDARSKAQAVAEGMRFLRLEARRWS